MRRSDGVPSAAAVHNLIRGTGARFAEKSRGLDHGEGRKVPRRNSYDVDDKRAQPWKKVGDGSHAQAVIHREALIKTAKEQRRTDWERLPNRRLREIREQRDALAAELAALTAQGQAPIGRPATIRHEIERLDATIARADVRLRRLKMSSRSAARGTMHASAAASISCFDDTRSASCAAIVATTLASWASRSVACSIEAGARMAAALTRLMPALPTRWPRRQRRTGGW